MGKKEKPWQRFDKRKTRKREAKILRQIEWGAGKAARAESDGTARTRRGLRVEDSFFDAWQDLRHDTWLLKIRRATKDQDSQGIDAIAETDRGEVFLQIKSGSVRNKKYYTDRGIVIIKIKDSDNYETIRQKTITTLLEFRESPKA